MKNRSKCFARLLVFFLIATFIFSFNISAGEVSDEREAVATKLMQVASDESRVKVYIRGDGSLGEASYIIGNTKVPSIQSYPIGEDDVAMRTLIMVDNSLSIPANSRPKISELLGGIIDHHAQNESFRLATFGEDISYMSDAYSQDYTALKNMIKSIQYVDQETFFTDVLYDLIEGYNAEEYMGYTRLIVISDGMDNKPIGITKEELIDKLKEKPYPIYAIGSSTGKNNSELENMFAVSRMVGAEYFILESTDTPTMVNALSLDAGMTVYEALIPEEAKIGGRQSSQMTFSDNSKISFDVSMPFHAADEPGKEENLEISENEPIQSDEEDEDEEEEEVDESDDQYYEETFIEKILDLPKPILFGGIAGIILFIVLIVLIIIKIAGRKKRNVVLPERMVDDGFDRDRETVMIDDMTSAMMPQSMQVGKLKFRITLTDKQDVANVFQGELKNSMGIGSASGNEIIIKAPTISRRHCMLLNKNGRIFIQDLNSTNGTYINGERIHIDTEIYSGAAIRMGNVEFIVKIDQA